MLHHVVEPLLNEAIDGALDLAEQARGRAAAVVGEVEVGIHLDPEARRSAAHKRFKRRLDAEFVK